MQERPWPGWRIREMRKEKMKEERKSQVLLERWFV